MKGGKGEVMNSPESIVLPLKESQALEAAGIHLHTALVWQRSTTVIGHPTSVHMKGDNSALGIEDFFEDICPAPVLSELLDAIRKTCPGDVVACGDHPFYYTGEEDKCCAIVSSRGCSQDCYGNTDLLAAYKLLMEVR